MGKEMGRGEMQIKYLLKNLFRCFLLLLGVYIILLEIAMGISEFHALRNYKENWFYLLTMLGIGISFIIISIKIMSCRNVGDMGEKSKINYQFFLVLIGIFIMVSQFGLLIFNLPHVDLSVFFTFLILFGLGILFVILGIKTK